MYWSDGVEFTADDIVFDVELVKATEGMSYHTEFNTYVDKVYAEDKYTVVFEFKEGNSRFHTFFVDRWGGFRPFPKHIFEEWTILYHLSSIRLSVPALCIEGL